MTRRVVTQGEEILRGRPGSFYRAPAESTGLYIGPSEPILTKEELQLALSVIAERERKERGEDPPPYPLTFSQQAAKTVRDFIQNAKPGEISDLARAASPELFAGGPEDFPGEDFPSDKPWPHDPNDDPEAA